MWIGHSWARINRRLRGNPQSLARILATLCTFVAGVVCLLVFVLSPEESIWNNISITAVSAFLAVTVSCAVDIAYRLLATSDLREIPLDIEDAARNEIYDTSGYYRSNCNICIELVKLNDYYKLTFHLSSVILRKQRVPTSFPNPASEQRQPGLTIKPPEESTKNIRKYSYEYKHNGVVMASGGSETPHQEEPMTLVEKETDECFTICYDLCELEGFKDDHRFTSAVTGVIPIDFTTRAAQQHQLQIYALKGAGTEPFQCRGRRYIHDGPLLSQQGFRWSIIKREI